MILNRATVEKGAHLQSLLKSPVNKPPAKFPSRVSTEGDVRPLSPPPHILLNPQKRSPSLGSPNRAPTERERVRDMHLFWSPPTISQNSQ